MIKLALLAGSALAIPFTAPAGASTVWAVGDGADYGPDDGPVVDLIAAGPVDQFLYLGDVYDAGTAKEYADNYDPSYGQLKSITKPTPGNHEWGNRAQGYDPYWGAGYSSPHYYSFDSGGWHFISLNSEEPLGEGSAELAWLRSDLARRAGTCTIAFWHRPRFSAGSHGDTVDTEPLWRAVAGRAAIVLSGHDHNYQRFNPIDGITNFVVGTGGKRHYTPRADARLAAVQATPNGALRLTLRPGLADYAFLSTDGANLDNGSIGCAPGLKLRHEKLRLRHGSRKLRLRVVLTVPAKAALRIERRVRGPYRMVERRSLSLDAGTNTVTLRRGSLRPGLYRLTLAATNAGADATTATAQLRIAR